MEPVYLSFYDSYQDEENIWFSNNLYNGLFKYNIDEDKTYFVTVFPNENWRRLGLHQKVINYKNKLFFIPGLSKYIHVYDVNSGEMESLFFPEKDGYNYRTNLSGVHLCNHILYVFPKFIERPVYMLNLETYEIQYMNGFNEECNKYIRCLNGQICFGTLSEPDAMWLPIVKSNTMIKYNFQDDSYTTWNIEVSDLIGIERFQGDLWLITEKAENVYRWNDSTNLLKEYILPDVKDGDGVQLIKSYKDYMFVFMRKQCDIYIFHIENDSFIKWQVSGDYTKLEHACSQWASFSGITCYQNRALINQFATNKCIAIQPDNSLLFYKIHTTETHEQLMYDYAIGRNPIHESEKLGIRYFCDRIDRNNNSQPDEMKCCGRGIHNYCMDKLLSD